MMIQDMTLPDPTPLAVRVYDFARESNQIEGIHVEKRHWVHARALSELLLHNFVDVNKMVTFVKAIEPNAHLRTKEHHRVWIGGKEAVFASLVTEMLDKLLNDVFGGIVSPWEAHARYECIHPFMDGNGRSGRALWLWMMSREEGLRKAVKLRFLQNYYYQTLSKYRETLEGETS